MLFGKPQQSAKYISYRTECSAILFVRRCIEKTYLLSSLCYVTDTFCKHKIFSAYIYAICIIFTSFLDNIVIPGVKAISIYLDERGSYHSKHIPLFSRVSACKHFTTTMLPPWATVDCFHIFPKFIVTIIQAMEAI
jgi:hypothetical protein